MSDYDWYGTKAFGALKGKTLKAITLADDKERMEFETTDGEKYVMYHGQDCCESVSVESVVGDLGDLIGAPLLQVEAVENKDEPAMSDYTESYTQTFYKLATIKGGVTIRWYGSSNGYYSESVTFSKIN